MKITSIERFILETIENEKMTYDQVRFETGLQDNICFNTLQALVIKNILNTNGVQYFINRNMSKEVIEKINLGRFKREESIELIENFMNSQSEDFVISKVALNDKDFKIFKAMLKNLESFVKDCHNQSKKEMSYKDRTFVFWGMTKTSNIINELVG